MHNEQIRKVLNDLRHAGVVSIEFRGDTAVLTRGSGDRQEVSLSAIVPKPDVPDPANLLISTPSLVRSESERYWRAIVAKMAGIPIGAKRDSVALYCIATLCSLSSDPIEVPGLYAAFVAERCKILKTRSDCYREFSPTHTDLLQYFHKTVKDKGESILLGYIEEFLDDRQRQKENDRKRKAAIGVGVPREDLQPIDVQAILDRARSGQKKAAIG